MLFSKSKSGTLYGVFPLFSWSPIFSKPIKQPKKFHLFHIQIAVNGGMMDIVMLVSFSIKTKIFLNYLFSGMIFTDSGVFPNGYKFYGKLMKIKQFLRAQDTFRQKIFSKLELFGVQL